MNNILLCLSEGLRYKFSVKFKNKLIVFLISSLFISPHSFLYAGESIFGSTTTTDTVPKGKFQALGSYAGKYAKLNGAYANSVYRTGAEYGVTDALQTSIHFNVRHIYAKRSSRTQTTAGEDVDESANPQKSFNDLLLDTVSSETVYRISSPVTNPIGTAVSIEPAFGLHRIELKPKLILQKNFIDDTLTWATNLGYGIAWREKTGGAAIFNADQNPIGTTKERWTKQSELEAVTGLSYRFIENWSGGFELRMHTVFSSFNPGDIESTSFFVGPNLHYGSRHFWMTLAILFQIPPAIGYTENAQHEIQGGRIFGNTHEAVEARLKMGYAFT